MTEPNGFTCAQRRFVLTWNWWGWPKYGWIFRITRTAKGGLWIVFGFGDLTLRWNRV